MAKKSLRIAVVPAFLVIVNCAATSADERLIRVLQIGTGSVPARIFAAQVQK
jgi:hypothetical protein